MKKMPQFFQDYLFGLQVERLTSEQREELLEWFDDGATDYFHIVNAVVDVLSEDYIEDREI
jgi:hypothetical protein